MSVKDFIRNITPSFLLKNFRKYKKQRRNAVLDQQAKSGQALTKETLIRQLSAIGIRRGDNIMVHSSLSKLGFVEGGPKTVVESFLELISMDGNVLMPNSPNASLQLDYIQNLDVFDVLEDKSALGAISEVFRKHPQAERSLHPTEPVSCIGKDSKYFTENHSLDETPYDKNSPWFKLAQREGKILYLGVSLDNAGTSLHCLEDFVEDFKFPVYFKDSFEVKMKDKYGQLSKIKTKVHNPVYSAKRQCDKLIPAFIANGVAKEVQIGDAKSYLFDAKKMLDFMVKAYKDSGVTMYTPFGS